MQSLGGSARTRWLQALPVRRNGRVWVCCRVDYEAVAFTEVTPERIYVGIERGAKDGVAVIQAARLVFDSSSGSIVDITMEEEPRWEVDFPSGMQGNRGAHLPYPSANQDPNKSTGGRVQKRGSP